MTFAGGFASTIGWPSTLFLIDSVGWRGAYLTFAAAARVCRRAAACICLAAVARVAPNRSRTERRIAARPLRARCRHRCFILRRGCVCGLRLHYIRPVGASAGDHRARRHRCRQRPSRSALCSGRRRCCAACANSPSASRIHPLIIARGGGRAGACGICCCCSRPEFRRPTAAVFAVMFGMSNGLDYDRARHRSARVVRPGRLRAAGRPYRACRARHAIDRTGDAGGRD